MKHKKPAFRWNETKGTVKKDKYRNGGSENQSCRFIGTWKCVCCTTAFFFCRRAAD